MNETPRGAIQIRARWLLLLPPLYVISYAILSFAGGWVLTDTGRWRPFGFAASDCIQWQPRFGFCQRFVRTGGDSVIRADLLGYFYAPLVLLDQTYVHPTVSLWRVDGDPSSGLNLSRLRNLTE